MTGKVERTRQIELKCLPSYTHTQTRRQHYRIGDFRVAKRSSELHRIAWCGADSLGILRRFLHDRRPLLRRAWHDHSRIRRRLRVHSQNIRPNARLSSVSLFISAAVPVGVVGGRGATFESCCA